MPMNPMLADLLYLYHTTTGTTMFSGWWEQTYLVKSRLIDHLTSSNLLNE